jgi:chondroitin 4-sulfotransferase 11
MINHKHKYIFIHIPKTAGSSLEVALGGHGQLKCFTSFDHINKEPLQHLTANEIKNKLGKSEYNKYYKFSFVRNPFSRCVSEYFWWRGVGKKNKYGRKKCETSFTQWVHEDLPSLIIENQSIDRLIKHNIEQHKFILDANNDKIVNFVGRFEKLQEDFNIVCDKIGIPRQKLPHTNQTKCSHYTEHYNDETKKIIEDYYARDIEYFDYKFGE